MVAVAGRGWRLAPCLVVLFEQADARWPNRSKTSDGSIGDADHSSRASDHNPDASGDVLAGDLTDDKAAGCDADTFAEHLRTTRDRRVKYVICNGRYFASYATSTRKAWTWVPYTGPNGHFAHTHVSVLDTPDAKNDLSPWFPPQDGNSATQPSEDFTMAGLSRLDAQKGVIRHGFRTILLRNPASQDELDWHLLALAQRGYEAWIEMLVESDEGKAVLRRERQAAGLP